MAKDIKITVTEELIHFFTDNNIFFGFKTLRLKSGDKIIISDDASVEKYSSARSGYSLPNMGAFTYTRSPFSPSKITFGRYCSIANDVRIFGGDHPTHFFSSNDILYSFDSLRARAIEENRRNYSNIRKQRGIRPVMKPIVVENDVWIGSHVALRPGITVHNGAVIATGAVVTKDVPPYAVVGGNPARILKYRFDEKTICKLLESEWWKYCYTDFNGISSKMDIQKFIKCFNNIKSSLSPFNPGFITTEMILLHSNGKL
jgi:acetyltransferase-like isoleucine patch superfamily enzyme